MINALLDSAGVTVFPTKQRLLLMFRMFSALLLLLLLTNLNEQTDASDSLLLDEIPKGRILGMKSLVKDMFYHGYHNYLKYSFPHDELKPLTRTYTDSFIELGAVAEDNSVSSTEVYGGIALTLIDSLSTLAVIGDREEFGKAVRWVISNLSFDLDVRVNVFETNIRVLGGLMSAHYLASDPELKLMEDYRSELIPICYDLGRRLLPAFRSSPSGIPYAWVNLRRGVLPKETTEQCTAGVGTLIFEFEMLSKLTGDPIFAELAENAMKKMWNLRSPLGLLGNTLDIESLRWLSVNSGIGAGSDSFFESLLKVYVILGKYEYLSIFQDAYRAVTKHLKYGPWYVDVNMTNGIVMYNQFNSLQAFWPGLQVLIGDIEAARGTHEAFYGIWRRFGVLPERYWLGQKPTLHHSERYYVLRPELIESTFLLHFATNDSHFQRVGVEMYRSLMNITRVNHGFASVRDVETGELEDRMESFFLSETIKYLYLLFDTENFVRLGNYVFSTEGHLFPVFGIANKNYLTGFESVHTATCPRDVGGKVAKKTSCHIEDKFEDHRCATHGDCGVSSDDCIRRLCSHFMYCFSHVQRDLGCQRRPDCLLLLACSWRGRNSVEAARGHHQKKNLWLTWMAKAPSYS
eukprot:TRINITY_DN3122_c0_g1_i2.p1 TRINITY_DN3122_c0_g1~~TRINITY_DN3122_c0_g1_i2.p1  ORF type:complete len:632 (-),score=103.87 TRINITY_DN3122_c0_g1_i2:570-2465(-)